MPRLALTNAYRSKETGIVKMLHRKNKRRGEYLSFY